MENRMKRIVMAILTLMLAGRAMTLAFIPRVGGINPGDPPPAWLMPLIGDAIVGITALLIAFLILRRTGFGAWTAIIVWNVVAIWDALSAFIIHTTNPWPEFFMIQLFGASMFFAASLMHLIIIWLATQADVKAHFLSEAAI